MMKFVIFLKILLIGLFQPIFSSDLYEREKLEKIRESWRYHLPDNINAQEIKVMRESPGGRMWFGGVGSIFRLEESKLSEISFNEDLNRILNSDSNSFVCRDIKFITEDRVVFLINQLIFLYAKGEWNLIYKSNIEEGEIKNLFVREDESLFILNKSSLVHISSNFEQKTVLLQSESNQEFLNFCVDLNKNIWVIAENEKILLLKVTGSWNKQLEKTSTEKLPIPVNQISNSVKLEIDQKGFIYMVDRSLGFGIKKFDTSKESWSTPFESGLARHHALHVDHENTVWVGASEAICRSTKQKVDLFQNEKWLPKTIVEQIYLDQSNNLWILDRHNRVKCIDTSDRIWQSYANLNFQCIGNNQDQWFLSNLSRVVVNELDRWTVFNSKDGIVERPIRILNSQNSGIIVFGYIEREIAFSIYKNGIWETWQPFQFEGHYRYDSIIESSDGSIWIGAQKTNRPNEENVKLFHLSFSNSTEFKVSDHPIPEVKSLESITQTPDDKLWIGGLELYSYDFRSKSLVNHAMPSPKKIISLEVTSDGSLWVAQVGLGIYQYKNEKWINHSLKLGLRQHSVADMLALHDGSLLVASQLGISRFDGSKWLENVLPEDFYLVKDGGSLHAGSDHSIWVNMTKKEGSIFDGMINRAYKFTANKKEPKTKITNYQKEIPYRGGNYITWASCLPNFKTNYDRIQYSWRINNEPWSDFVDNKEVNFSNLTDGSYCFEVKARDQNFNIESNPAMIWFDVAAPIWKQTWFLSLILFLSTMILYLIWAIIRMRERHYIVQQNEKEKYWSEVDRLKSAFFTNITHELRTPLTVISGRLESLLSYENDIKKKNVMNIIMQNTLRISNLITQLLDFKKIEEGNLKLDMQEGDIAFFIQQVVNRVAPLAKEQGCEITCSGSCHGWYDPDKLDKILTNLISNAIKYSPDGGMIQIKIEQTKLNQIETLLLEVEDRGRGIEPEKIPYIFERFYRIPEKNQTMGVGIGLDLTKELVQLWGGEISAESPVVDDPIQPGAKIKVALPIAFKSALNKTPTETEFLTESKTVLPEEAIHLLVVEDDLGIQSLIHDELAHNYRVSFASNGEDGINFAKEYLPQLIITDLMMPKVDGYELCKVLKSDSATSHIPIIMLTAKASHENHLKGLVTGADDYITKPFQIERLKIKVHNLLENYKRLKDKFSRHYMMPDQPIPEKSIDKEFMLKVFAILEEGVKNPQFDVELLAKKLHMSMNTLRRKVKAITDDTPSKLIKNTRLKMAASLLKNSELHINQIALEVGFSEANHFARIFKTHFKQTPSEYRACESSQPVS